MIYRLAEIVARRWAGEIRMTARAISLGLRRPLLSDDPSRPATIRKILAIRTDRMGDMILTLPAIDALGKAYPDAKIIVACRPPLLPLLQQRKGIDRLLPVPVDRTPRELSLDLAALEPDMLVDFSAPRDMLALNAGHLARIPVRAGFAGGGRELFLTDAVILPDRSIPLIEENALLVKAVGVERLDLRPEIQIPAADIATAETLLRQTGGAATGLRVAIHPGGFYPSQRMALETWSRSARLLSTGADVRFVLLGGPNELDDLDLLAATIGPDATPMPPLDLSRLAAVLSCCDLLLCNNSGPLHLASAVGTPTVSFAGPTDPVRFRPMGTRQEILEVQGLPCRPCGRGFCQGHECMARIEPARIAEAAVKLLQDGQAGITVTDKRNRA